MTATVASPRQLTRLGWVAGVAAVHASLFWLYWIPTAKRLRGDENTYLKAARAIMDGGAWYTDSLWPPGQSWLLAGILSIQDSLVAVQVVQWLLVLGAAWLCVKLGERLTGRPRIGWLAGALLLLYPPFVAYAQYLWPEVVHVTLVLLSWWLVLRRPTAGGFLLCGLTIGLALLFKSLLLPFLPAFLLLTEGTWRRRARQGAALILGVMLIIGPAAIGKQLTIGTPNLHTSGPFNLWVGLHDHTRQGHVQPIAGRQYGRYLMVGDTVAERNRAFMRRYVRKLSELGPVEVVSRQVSRQPFRLLDHESFLTTDGGYANAYGRLHQLISGLSYATYAALLVLAVIGVKAWPHTQRGWWLPLALTAYVVALFLILHAKARYRIVLTPCLCLFAAAGYDALRSGGVRDWWDAQGVRARIAQGSAALILLTLAFAGPWLDQRYPQSPLTAPRAVDPANGSSG